MGVPAAYSDESFATRCNFRPPNCVPKQVSMLPILTDWVATQECVEDNAKGPRLANARPSEKGGFTVKVAACNIQEIPGHQLRVTYKKYLHQVNVRTPPVEQNQPAPTKMVSGCAWSPGNYRALRLLGKSLDVAWEIGFICPLTFN
jgi:hypothetical protein